MAIDAAVAVITRDEAKEFLKKDDDEDIVVLDAIVNGVCQFIKGFTGRVLPQTVYTAVKYDGNGRPDFWLPNYPVSALTSVYENDVLLVLDTDFYAYLDTGRLRRSGLWTIEPQGIKTTYTGGYAAASIPTDIKLGCLIQVTDIWQKFQHKSFGEISRSLASQSVTVTEQDVLPIVKTLLARYRRSHL
jgi:hypothetical protein